VFVCLASLGMINTDLLHTRHSTRIEGPEDHKSYVDRPTVVAIHGWMNNFDESLIGLRFGVVPKVFKNLDVNLVKVIWFAGVYDSAVSEAPDIARTVADYLDKKLGKDQKLWKQLTIVGHSLGAHIAGKNSKFPMK
jgi:pimeloyl-ACP methyl ester carboxylesterase